jgi:hypothetical protein
VRSGAECKAAVTDVEMLTLTGGGRNLPPKASSFTNHPSNHALHTMPRNDVVHTFAHSIVKKIV